MNGLDIRWSVRSDWEYIFQIEKSSFEHPWDEKEFRRTWRQRNVVGWAAEYRDEVVGYCVFTLYPDAIEIINMAVAPTHRLLGVGSAMLDKLKDKLGWCRNRHWLKVAVWERNLSAQLFFRSQGFQAVSVEHMCYAELLGDDYVMRYECGGEKNRLTGYWKAGNSILWRRRNDSVRRAEND